MSATTPFVLTIESGLLHEHDDGVFRTRIIGFAPAQTVDLAAGWTYFGVVVTGTATLRYQDRVRSVHSGDYFSVVGPASLESRGIGIVNGAFNYAGANVLGGPIEDLGRFRYIDGCSDSLLVPPLRRGDPCLNFLHFPAGIQQTPHTHPSVRTGVVYRGLGECVVPDHPAIPLRAGTAFVIPTEAIHSFNTAADLMDVIAFHPDSDAGMTDDDHPMINRTIVNGVSARLIDAIRTTAVGG